MPQLEHIDIAHRLHKLALLIELGITGEEHAQALAFPSIGKQQDKRVLIALAIHRVKTATSHEPEMRRYRTCLRGPPADTYAGGDSEPQQARLLAHRPRPQWFQPKN